ncbi:MAG: cytochrome c biogenesis protein CcsA [Candidatus Methylacidiphilales bacterium]|nr:cytochrome c biogenesis protein CcsA [Candidatus Methylacidiphilales bacterium]
MGHPQMGKRGWLDKGRGTITLLAMMRGFFFVCFVLPVISLVPVHGAVDVSAFGLLAIQDGDRIKPVDTFAEESLIRISGRAEVKAGGRTWGADEWALSMLLDTHSWADEPLILVAHRPLVEKLGLDPKQKRFSFKQLAAVTRLQDLLREAHALRREEKTLSRELLEAENVAARLTVFTRIADGSAFLLVPSAEGAPNWLTPPEASPAYGPEKFASTLKHLQAVGTHYLAGEPFPFTLNANQLRLAIRALRPEVYPSEMTLKTEVFYNRAKLFEHATWIYLLAFFLLLAGRAFKPALRVGCGLAVAGVLLQTAGIVLRCVIAGRPPVTNMYESVIWVAWGAVAFGLVFALRYRTALYLLAALPAAALCLLIVHQIPLAMPARLDPLVPVLRSNFWLTVHVLTITLSYAAFLLAMAFGHIVLFRVIRRPAETHADSEVHFWLYRVLQMGVLLLAVGTILGGVWANYSWGRFWGWDPKETWALIALLAYIFALHGRLAGWWGKFGLAVASVACFLAVIMAWYGVNFVLGVGLHSYGFGLGGEEYVVAFVLADAAFVAAAIWRHRGIKDLSVTEAGV